MMIKFINKITGGVMWVHESRVDEYKAAGHRLAADLDTQKRKPKKTKK